MNTSWVRVALIIKYDGRKFQIHKKKFAQPHWSLLQSLHQKIQVIVDTRSDPYIIEWNIVYNLHPTSFSLQELIQRQTRNFWKIQPVFMNKYTLQIDCEFFSVIKSV